MNERPIKFTKKTDQELIDYQAIEGPELKLRFYSQFLSRQQSALFFERLEKEIDWKQESLLMYGKHIPEPRLTAFYGDEAVFYTYTGKKRLALPWTPTLLFLLELIEKKTQRTFNSVLLNYYRDGRDGMGLHSDNEPELGPQPMIVSLSLGDSRQFFLKHRQHPELKLQLALDAGALLIMEGKTQEYWRHSIPKQTKHVGPRINLTFRHINLRNESAKIGP